MNTTFFKIKESRFFQLLVITIIICWITMFNLLIAILVDVVINQKKL